MATAKPWGPVDPNSTHQRWSYWRFEVDSPDRRRRPGVREVRENAMRFGRRVFRSTVGECRVQAPAPGRYIIEFHVEGPPVHDAAYRASVRREWRDRFVRQGFGPRATLAMDVRLLAGSYEDGRPSTHLIVAPALVLAEAVE